MAQRNVFAVEIDPDDGTMALFQITDAGVAEYQQPANPEDGERYWFRIGGFHDPECLIRYMFDHARDGEEAPV